MNKLVHGKLSMNFRTIMKCLTGTPKMNLCLPCLKFCYRWLQTSITHTSSRQRGDRLTYKFQRPYKQNSSLLTSIYLVLWSLWTPNYKWGEKEILYTSSWGIVSSKDQMTPLERRSSIYYLTLPIKKGIEEQQTSIGED